MIVYETCSNSMEETTGHMSQEEEASILNKHQKSGNTDPNKKKPICPDNRCKEVLTFSNTITCKTCKIKVCLKHRFPVDHACGKIASSSLSSAANGRWNNRFLAALASRSGQECTKGKGRGSSSPHSTPSIKVY